MHTPSKASKGSTACGIALSFLLLRHFPFIFPRSINLLYTHGPEVVEPILPGDLVRQLVRGCGGAGLPLHQHMELVGDHLLGGGGVRGPAQAVQEEREEGEAGGGRPPVKEREGY